MENNIHFLIINNTFKILIVIKKNNDLCSLVNNIIFKHNIIFMNIPAC